MLTPLLFHSWNPERAVTQCTGREGGEHSTFLLYAECLLPELHPVNSQLHFPSITTKLPSTFRGVLQGLPTLKETCFVSKQPLGPDSHKDRRGDAADQGQSWPKHSAELSGGLRCCHLSLPEGRSRSKDFNLTPLTGNPPFPRLPLCYLSHRDSTALLATMTSHHHTHKPTYSSSALLQLCSCQGDLGQSRNTRL